MSDDLDRRLRERLSDLDLPAAPSTLRNAVDRLGAEPPGRPEPRWRGALGPTSVLAAAVGGGGPRVERWCPPWSVTGGDAVGVDG